VDHEVLRGLVDGLGERERRILLMRFFHGMTQTEIGERLGISQMQVSRLIAKILARLRAGFG
jgi:RNA polymerase sigma-B factor